MINIDSFITILKFITTGALRSRTTITDFDLEFMHVNSHDHIFEHNYEVCMYDMYN